MKHIFLSVMIWAAVATPAVALDLSGPAMIQDGDTIRIGSQRIRLNGIDAPEDGQDCERDGKSYNCGAKAEKKLRSILRDGVACSGSRFDDFGRLLADCQANGLDVSAEMVRSGWALAFRKYSSAYVDEEDTAQAAGIGMWAGAFTPPWEFRAEKWKGNDAPDPTCPIKGNISKGGRIYHTPWSRSYSRTRINTAKGERWFCNEGEALAAGWRAPYR